VSGTFLGGLLLSARRPRVLRRCGLIALVVGTLLTGVNQSDALSQWAVDPSLALKILANYVVPFVVSNLGAMTDSDLG
jgi:hypothetical protein